MPGFNEGKYKISFGNKSYIDALVAYNSTVWITHIYDHSGKEIKWEQEQENENLTLKNLPELIQMVQSSGLSVDEMSIDYASRDSRSMFGVFPKIQASEHQLALVKQQPSKAALHLSRIIYNGTYVDKKDGYRAHLMEVPGEVEPKSLTREEAMILVLSAKRFDGRGADCSGAIELIDLHTFVFEIQSGCFYISYGEQCEIWQSNIFLDLDDGFLTNDEFQSAMTKNIVQAMQPYFITWRANNYAGPLFPLNMGLNFDKVIVPIVNDDAMKKKSGKPISALQHRLPVLIHGLYNQKNVSNKSNFEDKENKETPNFRKTIKNLPESHFESDAPPHNPSRDLTFRQVMNGKTVIRILEAARNNQEDSDAPTPGINFK